jgi:hypothetical protein
MGMIKGEGSGAERERFALRKRRVVVYTAKNKTL